MDKHKSGLQGLTQRRRTTQNKIKRLEKMLKLLGGKTKPTIEDIKMNLEKRIKFWQAKL